MPDCTLVFDLVKNLKYIVKSVFVCLQEFGEDDILFPYDASKRLSHQVEVSNIYTTYNQTANKRSCADPDDWYFVLAQCG